MAIIPLASVDKLIRKGGADRVSEDAAQLLGEYLESYATAIAIEALSLAEHAKRKTIKTEDINLAYKKK